MNGFDPAQAARDAEPPATDAPDGADEAPGAGKGGGAVPPKNPWDESRVRRGAKRAPKPGAAAPAAGIKARLSTIPAGNLARHFATLRAGPVRPPLGRSWLPWIAGAVVVVWLGATSLHPVGAHEQAIVVTAGAWGPTQGPGLAVSWPWPVGSATIENVTSVRHLVVPDGEGEHLMLTRDGALVDVAYDVRWRISDLRDHALALADPDATLRLAAENAVRGAVAGMDFAPSADIGVAGSGLMGSGLMLGHAMLGHEAAQRLQVLLDRDHAGIAVTGIDIRRADPPARVAETLRAVTTARGDADTEAMQAHSWSRQLVATAQGEAGAFDKVYEQYRHAPDVIHRQMYYATMERVLAQSDKVIVDAPGTTVAMPAPTNPVAPPKSGTDTGAANGH